MLITDVFVLLTTNFMMAAASFTWTAPPPSWIPTNESDVRTVNFPVLKGTTNVALRWNYVLGDGEMLFGILWNIDGKQIASLSAASQETVNDNRFAVDTSEMATLIIKNVSDIEDVTIQCTTQTNKKPWKYNIQVEITVPPKITSYTHNTTVDEGSKLDLFCNTTGKPAPNITWTSVLEDGTNSNLKKLFVGNPWNITNINRNYSGTYRCTADNGIGSAVNRTISVNVLYAAKINYTSGNQTLNESDTFNPTCVADGKPTPSITWTRVSDSKPVSFPFNITGKQDEGGYRCTASNDVGRADDRIIHVFVQNHHPVNTRVTNNLTDNTVDVNETFSITCSAQANPPAKYRLYKGNEYVNGPDNDAVITTSVTERVKMVNYSCIPYNFYGNGTKRIVPVTVHYPPAGTRWTYDLTNTTVLRGRSLILKCSADANPMVHTYSLYFNGYKIGNNSLGIFHVTVQEDGVYTCVPLNTAGSGDNGTITIIVVDHPSVTVNKQKIIVVEGHNISLACNFSGKPDPTITWTKRGSSVVLSNTSSLEVVNVSRYDAEDGIIQFQCTASNGVGTPATVFVNVTVHYASAIQSASVNQFVLEGKNLTLHCNASGNPSPNITWTRDKSSSVPHQGSIYSIVNISRYAAGNYTCTAWNGVGEQQNATTVVAVHYGANIIFAPRNETVLEFNDVTFFCNATSNPPSQIIWTHEGNSTVLHKGETFVIKNVLRPRNGQRYKCTTWNNVTKDVEAYAQLTVNYAPGSTKLISVPSNTTVLRKSLLRLTCQVDSNPEAEFRFYFNGRLIETNSAGIFTVTVTSDGVYTCVPINIAGVGKNASVIVTAVEAPVVSVLPQAATIVDGNSLNLTCNVSGKPKPSIKWTVVDSPKILSNDSRLTVNVSRWEAKNNLIHYLCTASNGVGTPTTATVSVTVNYLEMTNKPENKTALVKIGQKVDLPCSGEGYPKPTITLTAIYINGSYLHHSSGDSKLSIKADSPFWFRCTVENNSTKLTKWFHLVLNVMKFETAITVVNKDCSNPGKIIKQLRELMTNILKESNIPIDNVESITFRCGSVTVYFSLIFSQNIEIEKILTVLKKAAEEKRFDDLQVDPKSIQAIVPERIPTTTTPTRTPVHPTEPKCKDGFTPERNCPLSVAFIVFLVVLAVILFSVTFAIIIYCLYKRRKCRKDSRVHSSQSEERPFSPSNENDYSQVNSGYAETGPRSTERANLDHNQGEEGAAAIPTYAVVDKSKKKGKKKDKKAAEMKPTEDQYAVVDKSKKKTKLKNEPDATYAEVDLQKKSKKKPKPGEVLYADLGEFHQMKKLPEVSTSPKALPPIKWPEASAETQYADITQFLKGNPEDPGAELPKDSSTPAVSNTATGSKEESSAGNAGDSAEAANETGF